ncbi:MAG: tetratricopeptide repeat protein [Clostridiales bacterium]|nr:tetratricopeptide repeat protein [Clostridiales bacterium]
MRKQRILKGFLSTGLLFIMIIILTGCSEAGGYYRSGKKYFTNGNYEEAAKKFKSAIDTNPNRAEYYIDYGMALIGLSRYDEAIEQFDRIIINKNMVIVLGNNKRALRGKGIAYMKMLNYREAIKYFDDALDIRVLSDLDMDILYYKGKALMSTGAYKNATEIYTDIIDKFGEEAQVLADRAYTYQKTGDYDKGLDDYDKAIALDPNNYEYYFGEFSLLREMGRDDQAQEVLTRAAEIEVKSKADKFNLAKIHFYQGLYDQAFPELSESFANGFIDAYFYIGEIYTNKKDYSTAKYYYEKYIEEGGINSPEVYNQLASCLIKTEEYDQALAYLEAGIEYAGNDMIRVLLKNEIIVYEMLGDYDKALTKLRNYISAYPDDKNAIRERSFVITRILDNSNDLNNQ